ncbi:hypothetical protein JM18_005775 [Phytophthora kernoviae]|uniref:Uncharacterized protein n=2 Tax=Phytophthora kernoviae TaxID=325452 RepID=A0A921V6Q5_9STRA|nr:hypothetical protein G195_007136 [Phytophthora kernoviae 00238/432]KAG2523467.1 hypothetical protein JM18_005775 [Phytophthora kernoviae]
MISPLKDIVIATALGLGAAMVWDNYKNEEMDRISRFYKWYDVQQLKKTSAHDDDDFRMRLYVHFEATDEAHAWTKRLNLPLVDDPTVCYIEMQKYQQAVEVLDELQTFLRVNSGASPGNAGSKSKPFFLDAKERLSMEAQMDVLKAQALYDTKTSDNQEKAISLIMHLLPDLQAPVLNLDALLLYARMADDRGEKSEALSMALRVLVGKSNDRSVKKTLVLLLKDPGSMERLQRAVPPTSPSAGAAYAYIATILKDFGAIEKSIMCFHQAQLSAPHSASYALSHAHALEVSTRYGEAYDVLASFFRQNRVLSVGSILEAVEKCKYESIDEGMKYTIGIFMDALIDVVRKYEFEAYIHPVVPVLDETRGMVVQYNKLFQKRVAKSRICKWLDFFDDLVYQTPYKLRPEFRLDGTHLHPSYLTNLEVELNKRFH